MSPAKAPFGSCEIYKKVSTVALRDFFVYVEDELRKKKIKSIVIRHYPELYDEKRSEELHEVLVTEMKFTVLTESSSVLLVNPAPFAGKVKASERQKLIKSERQFSFAQKSDTDLKKIYSFIETCRKERNQTLSMTLAEIKKTVSLFPDKFLFFQVGSDSELAAAAIAIRVSEDVLYTFYYAHAKKFDKVSPVVYLLAGIYEYAQKQEIKLLDLGTSMLNGKVNRSLLHFKESIGAVTNRKFTFNKTYDE